MDEIDASVMEGFRMLRQPGRPDPLARVLNVFEEETRRRLVELRKAVERADSAALERLAHAQKGSSGTMGALRMRDLSADLEQRGRTAQLDGTAQLVEQLARAFDTFARYARAMSDAEPHDTAQTQMRY